MPSNITPEQDMSGSPREVDYQLDPLPARNNEGLPKTLVNAIKEAEEYLNNLKALKEVLLSPDVTIDTYRTILNIIHQTHRIPSDTPEALKDFHIVQAHRHLGTLSVKTDATSDAETVS